MEYPKFSNEEERKTFWEGWHQERDKVWADLRQAGTLHPTLQEYFQQGEVRAAAYVEKWRQKHPDPTTAEEVVETATVEPETVEVVQTIAEEVLEPTEPQIEVVPVEQPQIEVEPLEQPRKQETKKPRKRRQPKQLDLFEEVAPEPALTTAQSIMQAVAVVVTILDSVVKVAAAVACGFIFLLVGGKP